MKQLKAALKDWNKTVFGNLDINIEKAVHELNSLDMEVEKRQLFEDEIRRRREVTTEMWQNLKAK